MHRHHGWLSRHWFLRSLSNIFHKSNETTSLNDAKAKVNLQNWLIPKIERYLKMHSDHKYMHRNKMNIILK